MVDWDRSMLAMSGAELEVQEALLALRRLLCERRLRATTRVVIQGAVLALENEIELRC